jgi:arylsulfatase
MLVKSHKLESTGLDQNTIVVYVTDNEPIGTCGPKEARVPSGDKGRPDGGARRVWSAGPALGGRVSSGLWIMTDLLPTLGPLLADRAVEKLKKGADYGGRTTSCISTATTTTLFTGKSEKSARRFVFYYDETVLTAIRYESFKVPSP